MKVSKSSLLVQLAGLAMVLCTSSPAAAVPQTVEINLQKANQALAAEKDRKSVAAFSHGQHADTFLKGNSEFASTPYSDDFTCKACHAGVKSAEEVGTDAARRQQAEAVQAAGSVKKYMHSLCLDCHKGMKKAQLATGPTSCKACHNRK